jgi:hypothetical protein
VAVHLIGQVVIREDAQDGECAGGGELFCGMDDVVAGLARPGQEVAVVGAAAVGAGEEEAEAAAEEEVYAARRHLRRDLLLHRPGGDVGSEGGGGRVRETGGRNEARPHPTRLSPLEHSAHGALEGIHADGSVVGLDAAGVGRGPGGGVRDVAVRGLRANVPREELVEREGSALRHPSHRERGRAEPVGDHHDHVPGPLAGDSGRRRSLLSGGREGYDEGEGKEERSLEHERRSCQSQKLRPRR